MISIPLKINYSKDIRIEKTACKERKSSNLDVLRANAKWMLYHSVVPQPRLHSTASVTNGKGTNFKKFKGIFLASRKTLPRTVMSSEINIEIKISLIVKNDTKYKENKASLERSYKIFSFNCVLNFSGLKKEIIRKMCI